MKKLSLNIIFSISILLIACSSVKQKDEESIVENKTDPIEEINYIPYYLKVYEADSLYLIGNYQRAYELLDSLFEKHEPLNQDLWYEMQTYMNSAYHAGHYEKIRPILVNLISNWGFNYEYSLAGIKNLKVITVEEENELRNKYLENIDKQLRDSVIQLNYWDQYYRVKDVNEKKRDSVDSVCYVFLLNHFQKNIYFKPNQVGRRTRKQNTSIDALLIHMVNDDSYSRYPLLRIVESNVKLGNFSPYIYASMVDKDSMNNGKLLKYNIFNTEMKDKNKVNIERKKIGLYSFDYMDWRNKNINY